MIKYLVFSSLILLGACETPSSDLKTEEKKINQDLDAWNMAAARSDFNGYFNFLTEDAVFIGTDSRENWIKKDFKIWAKPFFDKKKTWNFKSLERHIHFDSTGKMAWFDELLRTQMKICRGSGVLILDGKDKKWRLKQYVLSMTIPNDSIAGAIRIKSPIEDSLLKKFPK